MIEAFAPRSGARIAGRYELKKHLRGTGAVQVFRALDHQARGECALVLFDPERCRPDTWATFVRVVTVGADARVPGLVVLAGLPTTPSNPPYCVTEFPSGRGLDEVRRQDGRQDWKRALSLGVWFAEILDKVHGATHVAHRALTPARCVVGAGDSATVLDFGVAELEVAGSTSEDATYRAPEQQRGGGDVRSDVYSLAAILFELITGERPSSRMPPPLRSIVREAPKEVEDLFLRALAREPGRRFADLAVMSAAMQKWCEARPRLGASPTGRAPAPVPGVGLAPVSKLDDPPVGAVADAGPTQTIATPEMAVPRVHQHDAGASLPATPLGRPPGSGADEAPRSPNLRQKERTEDLRPAAFVPAGSSVDKTEVLSRVDRGRGAPELSSPSVESNRTEVFRRPTSARGGRPAPSDRTERSDTSIAETTELVPTSGTEVFSRPNVLPKAGIAPGRTDGPRPLPEIPDDRTVQVPRRPRGEFPQSTTLELPEANSADLRMPGIVNTPTVPLTQLNVGSPPLILAPTTAVQQRPVFNSPSSPKAPDSTPRPSAPPQPQSPQQVARDRSAIPTTMDGGTLKSRLITTNLVLGLLIVLGLIILVLFR